MFGSLNILFILEKTIFNLDKSFHFHGVLNLYFNEPVASVLLITRSLDLACFMTSGKVVGSDIAVSR